MNLAVVSIIFFLFIPSFESRSIGNLAGHNDSAPCAITHSALGSCDYGVLLRHPLDCSKFLQCGAGVEYIMMCPVVLLFNTQKQVCDWPKDVLDCFTTRCLESQVKGDSLDSLARIVGGFVAIF